MAKKSEKMVEAAVTTGNINPVSSYNGGEDVITIELQSLLTPIAILLSAMMISATIFFSLKEFGGVGSNSNTLGVQDTADTADTDADEDPAVEFPEMTTNIGTSPILGDKSKAKVAIVEYSDYQCPFCQRHWQETHGKLIENYVNSGEIIIVYRELPLVSLHPDAPVASNAALCARDQKGDAGYYQYHNEMFGGTIVDRTSYTQFAKNIGLDVAKFDSCVDDEKFADAIAADTAEATRIGIGATPGFVVGILDDEGNVSGVNIGGAYPYETFTQFIDQYLEETK